MRKTLLVLLILVGTASTLVVASFAAADSGSREIRARGGLEGYQETPATLSTTGEGSFEARVGNDGSSFDWTLSYANLEGTVTQAHIHFGARALTGGISIWLCGTAAAPGPAGTAACPAPGGTVSGTATAANVIGPAGQGIEAGAFAEALAAIRVGAAYANVHSTKWPGGEIRGQLSDGGNDD
jgi:hypothetical protein